MILANLKKPVFPASAPEWFIGVGYLTTAIVTTAVWLYGLVRLGEKFLLLL